MRIPCPDCLDTYAHALARLVAATSWLPDPATVEALGGPVFPTRRARAGLPRLTEIEKNDEAVGMYDDNTTPAWAIFWAHGMTGTRPEGWTIAHVWSDADEIDSYTQLANLAMVPEPFAALTDKKGPLTGYLRWHAWSKYGWKPAGAPEPEKPGDFDSIEWRYLPKSDEPRTLINDRINSLNNQRLNVLKPIMVRLGML